MTYRAFTQRLLRVRHRLPVGKDANKNVRNGRTYMLGLQGILGPEPDEPTEAAPKSVVETSDSPFFYFPGKRWKD